MKKFIIFAKHALTLLLILGPVFAHANCKEPKRGPPGPQGPAGTSFVPTYAAFNVPGIPQTNVVNGTIVPFSATEVSSGITNASGDMTFTKNGVYQVTFGVMVDPSSSADHFDIELAGTVVPGGSIFPGPGFVFNIITVMFTATAGEHLVVRNVSGNDTLIGIFGADQVASFISILQIH